MSTTSSPTLASTYSDLFPTGVTTTTGVPGSSSSTSTSSNNNGNGITSGFTTSASTYFQTVIISLVALALLTVLSVVFLYYRRRRLTSALGTNLSPTDWAFNNALFPGGLGRGGLDGPGGAGGGRGRRGGKDEKDYGRCPRFWEVVVDLKEEREGLIGRGAGEKMEEQEGLHDVSLDDIEGQLDGVMIPAKGHSIDLLPKLRPLTVSILTTAPLPPTIPTPTPQSSSRNQDYSNGRPTAALLRTINNPSEANRSSGGGENRYHYPNADSADAGTRSGRTTTRTGTIGSAIASNSIAPVNVSFLIAMPQPPPPPTISSSSQSQNRSPNPATSTSYDHDHDDDDFELPDVVIGSMSMSLGWSDPSKPAQNQDRYDSSTSIGKRPESEMENEHGHETDDDHRESWEQSGTGQGPSEINRRRKERVEGEQVMAVPLNEEEVDRLRKQLGLRPMAESQDD